MFSQDSALRNKFPHSYSSYNIPSRFLIKHVQDRPGHDRRYALDPLKISVELDFFCEIDLDEGLADTIYWYIEHDYWWKPLVPCRSKKLTKLPELTYNFEHYALE